MAGKVYLIGAGPGDYKLLTLKALECLQKADVVVYDRLANSDYLKLIKEGCELIDAGKASSNHTLPQEDINAVIAIKAKQGKVVARLKGGDPYVFGRGGEEGEYLFELGIDFEVVPGITSAIGGLCYAGIPITHRDYASSFHVITGHLKDEENDEMDWATLAQIKGTLVFLMGVANLQKIVTHLIEQGKCKNTPVALISWATRYNQSVVTGTLETIHEMAQRKGVKPPTLIVIGEVVSLRDKLSFFEQKSLFGKSVLVTRTRAQSSELVETIREQGGQAIEIPMIAIEKIQDNKLLEKAINSLENYTYLVFTSQNAVEIFFEALWNNQYDTRKLAHLQIVAIGPATANALSQKGILADLMPEKAVAESMCELLQTKITEKDKILLPNSSLARDYIKKTLEKKCVVDEVPVYNTVVADETTKEQLIHLLKQKQVDYITFTSSSTVRYFVELLGSENLDLLQGIQLISIGEITTQTVKAYGLTVYKQALKPTTAEMVACMTEKGEEL